MHDFADRIRKITVLRPVEHHLADCTHTIAAFAPSLPVQRFGEALPVTLQIAICGVWRFALCNWFNARGSTAWNPSVAVNTVRPAFA